MRQILADSFGRVMEKLGPIGAFVPAIAKSLSVALRAGDVDKIKAHAHELREGAEAQIALADKLDAVVVDGRADAQEAAEVALLVEDLIDEMEDVVTGVDEDDPVEPEATTPG